jgi:hypothetical protein
VDSEAQNRSVTLSVNGALVDALHMLERRYRVDGLDARAAAIRQLLHEASKRAVINVSAALACGLARASPRTPHASESAESIDTNMPFGAPAANGDSRISVRSAGGWGTSSYGQSPEELLGSPSEDDHDWRGGSIYMD